MPNQTFTKKNDSPVNKHKNIINYDNTITKKVVHHTGSHQDFHPSPVLRQANTDFITIGAYANMLVILAVMIAVILGGFYILKKLGIAKKFSHRKSNGKRLEIMDSLGVDSKTKVVLVRRDKNEHLIAINSQGNVTVIEQNIKHDPTPINFKTAIKKEIKK